MHKPISYEMRIPKIHQCHGRYVRLPDFSRCDGDFVSFSERTVRSLEHIWILLRERFIVVYSLWLDPQLGLSANAKPCSIFTSPGCLSDCCFVSQSIWAGPLFRSSASLSDGFSVHVSCQIEFSFSVCRCCLTKNEKWLF